MSSSSSSSSSSISSEGSSASAVLDQQGGQGSTEEQTGFTQFMATVPIIMPPVPQVVYDKYWLRLMTITAPEPGMPARLYAEFRPCRDADAPQGKEVKKPEVDGDIKVIVIDDIWALVDHPSMGGSVTAVMEGIFATLNAYAKAAGIF
jgi:hypothetical protein